jgi:hypothetical protein
MLSVGLWYGCETNVVWHIDRCNIRIICFANFSGKTIKKISLSYIFYSVVTVHNSTESLKFSYCTGWTYYGRNLIDLTNQYTFNVDNPWVIAICWSPLIISFQFTQKSSPLKEIFDLIGCKTVCCDYQNVFRIIQE